jgi:hypothetical protein
LDERVIDSGAGTKFHAIADLIADLVERVGRRKTVACALWIFATGGVTTSAVGLDGNFKSHEAT